MSGLRDADMAGRLSVHAWSRDRTGMVNTATSQASTRDGSPRPGGGRRFDSRIRDAISIFSGAIRIAASAIRERGRCPLPA